MSASFRRVSTCLSIMEKQTLPFKNLKCTIDPEPMSLINISLKRLYVN